MTNLWREVEAIKIKAGNERKWVGVPCLKEEKPLDSLLWWSWLRWCLRVLHRCFCAACSAWAQLFVLLDPVLIPGKAGSGRARPPGNWLSCCASEHRVLCCSLSRSSWVCTAAATMFPPHSCFPPLWNPLLSHVCCLRLSWTAAKGKQVRFPTS